MPETGRRQEGDGKETGRRREGDEVIEIKMRPQVFNSLSHLSLSLSLSLSSLYLSISTYRRERIASLPDQVAHRVEIR